MMMLLEINQFYTKIGQETIIKYLQTNRVILSGVHTVFDSLFFMFLYVAIFISLVCVMMSIVAIFSKKKTEKYSFNPKAAPFVTVQIPTYNELAALNCASNCLKFDYPKNKYEIIIGDDSNNPEVSKKIDEFAQQHKEIVRVTRRGNNAGFKPGNLNYMLDYSKGELISILDSDFLPDEDFLKRLAAPFQNNKKIGAVQARWKFINQNQNAVTILGAVIGLAFHHVYLPFMQKIGGVSFLCGSAEAVRKDLVMSLGKWQSGSLTEDIEFSLRLLNKGYDITYLEDYECNCEVPYIAKDLYRQQMRWAFGVISAFLQHSTEIIFNHNLNLRKKISIHFQGMGYFFSMLLVLMFFTGAISFVSNAPAPINIEKFMIDMGKNVLLTSGILISSIVALLKTKNKDILLKAILSSFTYGIIVTYYVNVGIFKAMAGKQMVWFMLNKNGNNPSAANH